MTNSAYGMVTVRVVSMR